MAHRNRWFTVLENGYFPWRTVVILSGKGQMRTSMEPLNMDFDDKFHLFYDQRVSCDVLWITNLGRPWKTIQHIRTCCRSYLGSSDCFIDDAWLNQQPKEIEYWMIFTWKQFNDLPLEIPFYQMMSQLIYPDSKEVFHCWSFFGVDFPWFSRISSIAVDVFFPDQYTIFRASIRWGSWKRNWRRILARAGLEDFLLRWAIGLVDGLWDTLW